MQGDCGDGHQHSEAAECYDSVCQTELHDGFVNPPQYTHDRRFGFGNTVRQQNCAQRGRDGERRQQAARNRVRVGLSHRTEDVSFDTAEGEQRHEAGNDDCCSEQDRLVDLGGGIGNDGEFAAKHTRGTHHVHQRAAGTARLRTFTQMPEDVLDHDDRGVDDQTEVDRTDRQQIRGLATQSHQSDRKRQCERNSASDDQSAAQVAEEGPLQQEDQHNPRQHVVQHRTRSDVNQIGAIVDALDSHSDRQDTGAVDGIDLRLHTIDGWHALLTTAHQNDALNDVVRIRVLPGNTETRLVADLHSRNVPKQHRYAMQ